MSKNDLKQLFLQLEENIALKNKMIVELNYNILEHSSENLNELKEVK